MFNIHLEKQREIDNKNRFNKRHLLLYGKNKIEGIDFVKCPFCEERFLYLGSHFTNIHNITIKKYRESHPGWESKCKVFTESRRKGALDSRKHGNKHTYVKIDTQVGKENQDFIYCKICNKPFKNLGNHLKTIHKIDALNYLHKFPNSFLIAPAIKNSTILAVTKPLRDRIGEEKTKEVIEQIKHTKIKHGTNIPSVETRLKISKSNTGKKKSIESKRKQGDSLREGYLSGRIPRVGRASRGQMSYYRTPIQGTKLLRSNTELKYAQILDVQSNCGKDFLWLYEPIIYKVDVEKNRKPRSISPDFQLLFDWNIGRVKEEFGDKELTKEQIRDICSRSYDRKIEETKGRWIKDSPELNKWNNFIKQYPDEKIEVVMSSVVDKIFKKRFGHLVDFIARKKYYEKQKQKQKQKQNNIQIQ